MKTSSTASSSSAQRESPGLYLAIGASGLLLALVLAEVLLRTLVTPVIDSRANRVGLVYRASRPDAVLGDSHLYRPFINSERFANLARAGSSPHALEIVAREYFRHIEPGRVILEASPQLFNGLMQQRLAQHHDEYFSHNFGQPAFLHVFEPGISRELASVWDVRGLLRAAQVARGRQRREGAYTERQAAQRRALSAEARRELTAARIRSNHPVPDVTRSEGFAAYSRTLDFLLSRGARVCLARTPVTDLYREMSGKDAAYLAAEGALRNLAAERGVRFVDYLDLDLPLRVDAFTNPDHLTTSMGELYAARLEQACFEPATSARLPVAVP